MPRLLLTDESRSKLRPMMLDAGMYDKADLRRTVEGILVRLRLSLAGFATGIRLME